MQNSILNKTETPVAIEKKSCKKFATFQSISEKNCGS